MTKAEIRQKVQELIQAPSCYAGLKTVGEEWLAAEGTAGEKAAGAKLIAELEADVQTIDEVLGFFGSEAGRKAVGQETADKMAAHFREVKAAGGKWCDCPACTAGRIILDNREVLL